MPLAEEEKRILLELARAAVSAAVCGRPLVQPPPDLPPALNEKRGAFVTLMLRGRLRGCIGLIEDLYPLAETVVKMAVSAAKYDPRFPMVRPEELDDLQLEISILSPLKQVPSADDIQLGRDGVIVRQGAHCGVFLPQVAEEMGWNKEQFLNELCAGKAGLPADAWKDPASELTTFTVEILQE